MKRHALLIFWVLGFLFSWLAWVPLARGYDSPQAHIYGAYGPALAAMLVTLLMGSWSGLQELISRFFIWRVGWKWYGTALLLPVVVSLLVSALSLMCGGDLPDFSHPMMSDPRAQAALPALYNWLHPWPLLVVPVFLQFLLFSTTIGEELGWRGFGLQQLQQRFSPMTASIMLGCLWILWRLPIFYVQVAPNVRLSFLAVSLLGTIPVSILLTWIYNRTGGSLLMVLLFNTATKVTDLFVATSVAPMILVAAAYWGVVFYVLYMGGREALAEEKLKVES